MLGEGDRLRVQPAAGQKPPTLLSPSEARRTRTLPEKGGIRRPPVEHGFKLGGQVPKVFPAASNCPCHGNTPEGRLKWEAGDEVPGLVRSLTLLNMLQIKTPKSPSEDVHSNSILCHQ